MHLHSKSSRTLALFFQILFALILLQATEIALAQQDAAPSSTNSTPAADKKSSQTSSEQVLTFTKRVNLVVVSVVVRGKDGKAIGSLKREDFQIFDDGKPQLLSSFSIETSLPANDRNRNSVLGNLPIDKVLGVVPAHYFAYLFDDVHLHAGDLMQVRVAAKKHLETGIGLDDRAAVFTTSGDVQLEFTNDKTQLTHAMDRIKPGFNTSGTHCPYMNYYLAQQIVEFESSSVNPAWDGATIDTLNCMFANAGNLQNQARQMAMSAARLEIQIGDANTRQALLAIQGVVRRLAAMPGSRTLVLVSSGFHTSDDHLEQNTAIDLATGRNIIINALDTRGLYTGIVGADENGPSTPEAARLEDPINRGALLVQTNVMAELAEGTGGKFIHDSNDLLGGFNQIATPPEFVYVLGFKPEQLSKGGRYHHLKVKLSKQQHGLELQARRGYYESPTAGDPEKLISDELQKALFSREELHNLPITLQTGYAKKEGTNRELSITTHLDTNQIRFHKVDNKNVDNLTVVCGLFDINGNYLQGKKTEIAMHMDDDLLKQVTAGMNVKTTFDVEPGAYMIRVVVRDSGDEILSAVNASGLIP